MARTCVTCGKRISALQVYNNIGGPHCYDCSRPISDERMQKKTDGQIERSGSDNFSQNNLVNLNHNDALERSHEIVGEIKNQRKIHFLYIAVPTYIFSFVTILSIPAIMMSPMMFDAPGSSENVFILCCFYSLLTFPIVSIASTIIALVKYSHKRYKDAVIVCYLPLLNIIIFSTGCLIGIFTE